MSIITITELARSLGIPAGRIRYAHQTGKLPDVRRIAVTRVYEPEEVEKVRNYFGQPTTNRKN
jgi:hypothetical protein